MYKVPKILYQTQNIKKKPRQNKSLMAKVTKKRIISRTTSKHIYNGIIIRFFKKYQG